MRATPASDSPHEARSSANSLGVSRKRSRCCSSLRSQNIS
jgi:hypothetical protein